MRPTILISFPVDLAEGDCACPDSGGEELLPAQEQPVTELRVRSTSQIITASKFYPQMNTTDLA